MRSKKSPSWPCHQSPVSPSSHRGPPGSSRPPVAVIQEGLGGTRRAQDLVGGRAFKTSSRVQPVAPPLQESPMQSPACLLGHPIVAGLLQPCPSWRLHGVGPPDPGPRPAPGPLHSSTSLCPPSPALLLVLHSGSPAAPPLPSPWPWMPQDTSLQPSTVG